MNASAAPPLQGSLASWCGQTVAGVIRAQASDRPQARAFRMVGEPALTYAQLYDESRALAAGLRAAGIGRGDTVAIFGPNSREAVLCWLAVNLLGAVEVCINTAYRGAPLLHALNSSQARHIVVHADLLPLVQELCGQLACLEHAHVFGGRVPEALAEPLRTSDFAALRRSVTPLDVMDSEEERVAASDIASIIYTSGTTGPAKGVLMPHAQVCLLAAMSARGLKLTHEDVFYCFHPMFHMAGKFMAVLGTWMAGGEVVLDRSFEAAQWLARVREVGATAGLAHGPMVEMIHAQPARPDDRDNPMRRMIAAPFPTRIAHDFEQRFGLRGVEVWGMTEVGVPVWCALDEPLRLGSCGRADEELFEVEVVDPATDAVLGPNEVGELVVRPRRPWLLMQGYIGLPEETLSTWRNLWFHSGDSAYRDAEGNYFFVDRQKDRIRRRAENISSYEIESQSLTHLAVAEAAAVGVPSGFEGDDDIKLCVVIHPQASFDPAEFLEHLASQLPHHMLPRYIETLSALPRTPTNKVRKAELRQRSVDAATVWDRKAANIRIKDLYAQRS